MNAEALSLRQTRTRTLIAMLEEALIEELNRHIPVWVDIEPWPENTDTFDFANRKGALLIHYAGSRYANPQGQSSNQKRAVSFALVLKTRSLKGEYGAYDVLEDIRQCLQGLSLEGSGPLRMVSDDLVSEAEGVWQWQIIIALPADAVARRHPRNAAGVRPVFPAHQSGA